MSFQSGFLLFLFLLWLLWLKVPKLCWIVVVKVNNLVLFLTLGEMLSFQFFTIEDNVCCEFVIYSFYYVEVCSLYFPAFWRVFIINGCWILSKSFSIEIIIWFLSFNFLELFFYHKWMLNFAKGFLCIYWDNHMVFISQFVNVVYYIVWFPNIEKSLHPWGKAHLVTVYDLFNMLLDSDCQNFVKDFCI